MIILPRLKFILLYSVLLFGVSLSALEPELPTRSAILAAAQKVNDNWINNHRDPGNNLWARAAYFVGNVELYKVFPKPNYLCYANAWADKNKWAINGGSGTTNADNHACGQVYLDLFLLDGAADTTKIQGIKNAIDNRIANNPLASDWWWVDALFMGMPTITRLGVIYDDPRYFDRLYALFSTTRDTLLVNPGWWTSALAEQYAPAPIVTCPHCGNVSDGLYNVTDGLWWRDFRYQPGVPPLNNKPKITPAGNNVYWSRGNGWVFAALARTLELLPGNAAHRQDYIDVFVRMAQALKSCQREDGFWNMNLADAEQYAAPETSGTAFFAYGLAWGLNNGFLDHETYYPVAAKAWNALETVAVDADGNLRYTQNVGDCPIDPAQLTTSSVDFGVGAVLLAAAELSKLAYDDGLPPFAEMTTDENLLSRIDWTITTSSGGPVDDAPEVGGYKPEYMIDGDLNSAFLFVKPGKTYKGITVPAGTKPWFAIDLKRTCDMSYLLYRHRDFNDNTVAHLRVSRASFYGKNTETEDYQPVSENFNVATDKDEVHIDLPEKVSYRYVKLVFEAWDTSSGYTVQTSEFNLGNDKSLTRDPEISTKKICVFPNPVHVGQPLYIRSYDQYPDMTVSIYTVQGTRISERKYKTNLVQQIFSNQGTYFAEVCGNTGRFVSKIVVD